MSQIIRKYLLLLNSNIKLILSKYINGNLIDCYEVSKNDYLNCKESQKFLNKPIDINDKTFLKIKGVSYSAKESDIKSFFKQYYISENGIKILKNKRGNSLGEAIIAFMYEKDYEKALKEKNREMLLNQ
jgi:RNA recognition motif-containing protein